VILPSLIDTPANRESMPQDEWHKLVPPERIAEVVAFLCADASVALNGAALPV
jgi:NAD(P)-dependent dehydrogenase (short-subunit alcohol dehydrogenase family)